MNVQSTAQPVLGVRWMDWRVWPWWAQCVALWLVLVLVLSLAGFVGAGVVDLREGYDPVIGLPAGVWPAIWARWDAPYYFNIARDGYQAHPYAMGYFPLYPLLIKGLTALTGLHLVTAGVLIAHGSYLVALLAMYRLAMTFRGEAAFAWRAVVALAVFPSAFFFLAMYAESLALAAGLLVIDFALRGRWIKSGLALAVAAATRPVGWLLGLVLLVEFLRRRSFNWRSLGTFAAAGALGASGLVVYILYLHALTGSFTAIPHATALWLRTYAYPWQTLWDSLVIMVAGNGVPDDWFLYVSNLIDLGFTVLILALIGLAIRRLPLSLIIYMAVSLVFLLSLHGVRVVPLWGLTRWAASLAPIYLVLADRLRGGVRFWLLAGLSAAAQIALMVWWASGRWVG